MILQYPVIGQEDVIRLIQDIISGFQSVFTYGIALLILLFVGLAAVGLAYNFVKKVITPLGVGLVVSAIIGIITSILVYIAIINGIGLVADYLDKHGFAEAAALLRLPVKMFYDALSKLTSAH